MSKLFKRLWRLWARKTLDQRPRPYRLFTTEAQAMVIAMHIHGATTKGGRAMP